MSMFKKLYSLYKTIVYLYKVVGSPPSLWDTITIKWYVFEYNYYKQVVKKYESKRHWTQMLIENAREKTDENLPRYVRIRRPHVDMGEGWITVSGDYIDVPQEVEQSIEKHMSKEDSQAIYEALFNSKHNRIIS